MYTLISKQCKTFLTLYMFSVLCTSPRESCYKKYSQRMVILSNVISCLMYRVVTIKGFAKQQLACMAICTYLIQLVHPYSVKLANDTCFIMITIEVTHYKTLGNHDTGMAIIFPAEDCFHRTCAWCTSTQ